MHIAARSGRSLHGIGDRSHLNVLRGFVGTVYLHELDGVACGDFHDVALFGVGKRCGELTRESRERHHTHLAAVGSRCVVNRVVAGGLREIGTIAQRRQQTVGQRLLRIRQYDVANAHRVGSHLRIEHTGHRPLVVFQHGTVHLAGHQRLGLLVGKLCGRNEAVGDLTVAVAAHEGLHLPGSGKLTADLGNAVLERQQVVVRGRHLEHDVGDRTRRGLLEHVLMAVVISFQVARRHFDERIGNCRIFLAGPFACKGVVGGFDTLGNLQRVDVDATLHQTEVFLHFTFETSLFVDLRPSVGSLGIGLGMREELADGSHVVLTRAGIGKGVVESLRRRLTADHRQTLGLRDAKSHPVETGRQHILGDKRLPNGIGQHGRLLLVALLHVVLLLNLLVLVVVLRIVDLLAVDHADTGIVTRETHFGLQREDECQEGQCDNDRKHDAELGS